MRRKGTTPHRRWHRVVDGQIRDCMRAHPEYFAPGVDAEVILNSIAKRIVGEIVARVTPRHDVGPPHRG